MTMTLTIPEWVTGAIAVVLFAMGVLVLLAAVAASIGHRRMLKDMESRRKEMRARIHEWGPGHVPPKKQANYNGPPTYAKPPPPPPPPHASTHVRVTCGGTTPSSGDTMQEQHDFGGRGGGGKSAMSARCSHTTFMGPS